MTESNNSSEPVVADDSAFAKHVELDLDLVMSKIDCQLLEKMYTASEEMTECMRIVESAERTMIHEVLDGEEHLDADMQYPRAGDIRDETNGSQFFYHQHRDDPHEHGHFHLFLRAEGIPKSVTSSKKYRCRNRPSTAGRFAQLFVISMDHQGQPLQIFTNNRWVADETFFDAPQLIKLLDRFRVEHSWPSSPLNRWVSAFPVLFRPQVEAAILARDEVLAAYASDHPKVPVLEDESLEVTSIIRVDFAAQIEALCRAMG